MILKRVMTMGLGLLAAAAGATPPTTGAAPEPSAAAAATPALTGGLIFTVPSEEARIDEVVGELLLDPAIQEALRADWEGLVEEALPDGGVTVDLRGRFQSVVMARLADDGSLRFDHLAQPIAPATPQVPGPVCEDGRTADTGVRP